MQMNEQVVTGPLIFSNLAGLKNKPNKKRYLENF